MPGASLPDPRELGRTWQAVLGHLQLELNRSSFQAWLCGTRPVAIERGCLLVETPNAIHVDWMNSRFSTTVRRALAAVQDEPLEVRFVPRGTGAAPASGAAVQLPPPVDPARAGTLTAGRVDARLTLDCYHTSPANQVAYDACAAILESPAAAPSPVAIWGAPGLGKTHLLHGLALRALDAGWSTACISAEAFTSAFQDALRARDVTAFKASLRDVRLLIVDDLQYFAGKRATQEELGHTIDAVMHNGGHVVVAGELHPMALNLAERLATRLGSGITTRIEAFQAPDRRAFVESLIRDARASLPPWAIDRLAAPANLSIRLLRGAVATALARQRSGLLDPARLDGDLAAIELRDQSTSARTPADILAVVAAHFGTTTDQLAGRSRNATVASARAVAAAALKDQGLSLAEVAVVLGGRNRTTLSPVVQRGRQLLAVDDVLRARLAG